MVQRLLFCSPLWNWVVVAAEVGTCELLDEVTTWQGVDITLVYDLYVLVSYFFYGCLVSTWSGYPGGYQTFPDTIAGLCIRVADFPGATVGVGSFTFLLYRNCNAGYR